MGNKITNEKRKENNKSKNKGNNKPKNKINKKKMKTSKKVLIVLGVILLIALIVAGVFAYKVHKNGGGLSGMIATAVGHDEFEKKDVPEFRCLLLGISTDQENVDLTDTIMVASYNPKTQKASLLSIPRDTYTGKNPARATAYEKINALYSRKHRPDETLKAVNQITGLDIEYYVVVKTEALIKLVDAIGGVTFDVPIRMKYTDTSQDLVIDLQKGVQKIDGAKAEQLLRFRKNDNGTTYSEEYGGNDTGRMRTQREFIQAVIKETAKPSNIFKLKEILDIAKEYIITNVDFEVAKDYLPYVVEFNTENLLTAVLPGTNTNKNSAGTWIFVHNKKETAKLVQELFVDRDLTEEETTGEAGKENAESTIKKEDIKIEVLNGSGNIRYLQDVTSDLKGAGYNVTRTGTTTATSKTTIINKGNVSETTLKNIKEILGAGTIEKSQSNSGKVNITIVIGKDY